MARDTDRIYVYDTRSGNKATSPVPRAHLRLYPFLREVPSSGRIPSAPNGPQIATVTEPSQAPPSAAVPPVITPDSGPAAHQED